jgi:hypothetical protein
VGEVGFNSAGIFFEILTWAELGFVDENRDQYQAIVTPQRTGFPDQAQVSIVQIAHRGHHDDRASVCRDGGALD